MNIEISQITGIIRISKRKNDILYKQTYIDYSLTEAKKLFKQYFKTI